MLDKELLARFWRDFHLTTQDEDASFPIANPQDAARVLVKCRNWIGTFTEQLIAFENMRVSVTKDLQHYKTKLKDLENLLMDDLIAEGYFTPASLKNKDFVQMSIRNKEIAEARGLRMTIQNVEAVLIELNSDQEMLENLIKRIEKTTDYLVQYLNWVKYEVRTLQ
jgi:hypothetical protein